MKKNFFIIWFCIVRLVFSTTTYEQVGEYSNGLINVSIGKKQNDFIYGDKWGYIDISGKIVIPLVYQYAYPFEKDGFAIVKKDNKFGVIDKRNNIYIGLNYEDIYYLDGNRFVVKLNDKYGLVDINNKIIIPIKYEEYLGEINEFLCFKYKEKIGLLNFSGDTIVPFKYDNLYEDKGSWLNFNSNTIAIKNANKYGFIDLKTGREVTQFIYDDVWKFSEGLAPVLKNGKWGFIDESGEEKISFSYDYVGSFNNGLAAVLQNKKWGFIDKRGKIKIDFKYDEAHKFQENFCAVKANGKWGFIDKNDNIIIESKYEKVTNFYGGRSIIMLNGKYGIIDNKGKLLLKVIYDSIEILNNDFYKLKKEGKFSIADFKGNLVLNEYFDNVFTASNNFITVNNSLYKIFDSKGKLINLKSFFNIGGLTKDYNDGYILVLFDQKNEKKHVLSKFGFMDINGNVNTLGLLKINNVMNYFEM